MALLSGRAFAPTLIFAPPLAFLLWLSGAVAAHAAVGAMLVFVLVVMLIGQLLLRAAGASAMPAAAAWVLGLFATALAVYAIAAGFGLTAGAAFTIWAIVVVAIGIRFGKSPSVQRLDAAEIASLVLCGAITLMWCWDTAAAPRFLARDGVFPAWIDFIIHGGVISQLGDPRAVGRGSIDLAGFPAPLYHYASYVVPAAFASALDLPGLPLATSVWLPLGYLTMCAGAYALGAALGGPAGGLGAVAAVALIPDAASYGLRNGLFGYHWNILGGPGSAYAIGFCLLAIALVQRWTERRDARPLVAAMFLLAGTALVRLHVFALAFPAIMASVAMATALFRRRRLAFFAVAMLAFALFVAGFYWTFPFAAPAVEPALEAVHGNMEPTAYTGWYRGLLESHGPAVAVPAGLGLVYLAALGGLAVLYPLSLWLVRRSQGLAAIDPVPAAFLACYLLLWLAAPVPQHGDPTELTQRPFVILYAVLAIWTIAGLVRWWIAQAKNAARRAWLVLLVASALALPLLWPHTGALGKLPRFTWGREYANHKFQAGLFEAGQFLRAHSRPGDVFAARDVPFDWVAVDVPTELAALTGMPAYLGRPFIHFARHGRREQVAWERYWALVRMAREEDAAFLMRALGERGVRWYVVVGEGPSWDPQRRRAAFVSGRVALYLVAAP